MTDCEEIIDWIQLANSNKIGPVSFFKLLNKYASAKEALKHQTDICSRDFAVKQYETALKNNISILRYCDKNYPSRLKDLADAPPVLYVSGNISNLTYNLAISVVGSRNASINSRKLASRIAYDLCNNDIMIISGMARGIDTSAHKGALYAQNQKGKTIAVLGTGIDIAYPSENQELYQQILLQGNLISEFPFGTGAQISNFPRRNRIISALCDGLLVAGASTNSGSLITAQYAKKQGKTIFAIPGNPSDGRTLGCNQLIKEGAVLVNNSNDIFAYYHLNNKHEKKVYVDNLQKNNDIPKTEETDILSFLDYDGTSIDEIIRISGKPPQEILLSITELEMDSKIQRISGNKIALKR